MPAKKQITKEMILHSAFTILQKHGIDAVNVKTLAKELHCSTQPVYLSFDSMDALRSELIPFAINYFIDSVKCNNADNKICLYGPEYLHFAKTEPQLFCFLFMRPNAFNEMKQMLSSIMEASITELMNTYHISHEEADCLHDHLWMHAHGIASMIATNYCDWDIDKAERMLAECTRAFTQKYEV